MNTVSISRKTLEDWALSLSQGDISPRWEIEDLLAQAEQPAKITCHAEGERCYGCAHYRGEAGVCEFAEQPEAGRDDLLPCAWCGSPAESIGMAGIPEPYADREMFTCSNEECMVGEASFSRNQWNRRDYSPAHDEAVMMALDNGWLRHADKCAFRFKGCCDCGLSDFLAQHGGRGDE